MAGVAGEGLQFEDVVGQNADLMDLQRMLNRSKRKMSAQQQQQQTRWAVYQAASLLKSNAVQYERLMTAMEGGKSVVDCIKAIEGI